MFQSGSNVPSSSSQENTVAAPDYEDIDAALSFYRRKIEAVLHEGEFAETHGKAYACLQDNDSLRISAHNTTPEMVADRLKGLDEQVNETSDIISILE